MSAPRSLEVLPSLLCLARLALFFSAVAAERGYYAHDGDTCRATFRIANIDAPEIDGKCDYERKLAIEARDFTRAWLAKGGVIMRQDPKRGVDQNGRILVLVERSGEDLGRALISRGLARALDGKRRPWC